MKEHWPVALGISFLFSFFIAAAVACIAAPGSEHGIVQENAGVHAEVAVIKNDLAAKDAELNGLKAELCARDVIITGLRAEVKAGRDVNNPVTSWIQALGYAVIMPLCFLAYVLAHRFEWFRAAKDRMRGKKKKR